MFPKLQPNGVLQNLHLEMSVKYMAEDLGKDGLELMQLVLDQSRL